MSNDMPVYPEDRAYLPDDAHEKLPVQIACLVEEAVEAGMPEDILDGLVRVVRSLPEVHTATQYQVRWPDGTTDEFADMADVEEWLAHQSDATGLRVFERRLTRVTTFTTWAEIKPAGGAR